MAEARMSVDWSRTANLLAMLYNINRPKSVPAISPAQLNPFAKKKRNIAKGTDALFDSFENSFNPSHRHCSQETGKGDP